MVYSIVFIPDENVVQIKSFRYAFECSDYHNFVAITYGPRAVVKRANNLDRAIELLKSFSICL